MFSHTSLVYHTCNVTAKHSQYIHPNREFFVDISQDTIPSTDAPSFTQVQQRPAPTPLNPHPIIKSSLNPHPVIPPIEETLDRISAQTWSDPSADTLAKYIPSSSYLTSHPIALSKTDELRLMQRVSHGLGPEFDKNKLKDVYTALVEHDEELSGYVAYTNIGYALLRAQVG